MSIRSQQSVAIDMVWHLWHPPTRAHAAWRCCSIIAIAPLTVALGFLRIKRFSRPRNSRTWRPGPTTVADLEFGWQLGMHFRSIDVDFLPSVTLSIFQKRIVWCGWNGSGDGFSSKLLNLSVSALCLRPVDDLLPATRLRHRHRRRWAHPHAHRDLRHPLLGEYDSFEVEDIFGS